MNRLIWDDNGTQDILASIGAAAEHAHLNLAEHPRDTAAEHPYDTAEYVLTIVTSDTHRIVSYGEHFKDTTSSDAATRHRRAYHRREKLSRILNIPHQFYQQDGEKVISALGLGKFNPLNNKHLSPLAELAIITDVLETAGLLGLEKITRLGHLNPTPDTLQEALHFLNDEPYKQATDLIKGSYDA